MNCPDCQKRLDDYVDDTLSIAEARQVHAHLAGCPACRARLDALQALRARTAALPRELPPSRELWTEIQLEIGRIGARARAADETAAPADSEGAPTDSRVAALPASVASTLRLARFLTPLAIAAGVTFLLTLAERTLASGPGWSVAAVSGTPRLNSKAVEREARFRLGQVLETDAAARAKVAVGTIGEVTVDSNSRLRLVGMSATNHRLNLQQGSMHAMIWAPPRLFFVDTPSATAVDLGCEYTLTVDANGDGELHVLTGYVALEHGTREAIVPRGLKCLTRRRDGPGTPFAANASAELRAALTRFDFDRAAGATALPEILARAQTDDAVTLWHLLARTTDQARADVYDTLARLVAPPPGVTRAGILAGDTAMRRAWGTELGIGAF